MTTRPDLSDPIEDCKDVDGPCAWSDAPSTGWVAALDAWSWVERTKGEWSKTGPCPRCGHTIGVIVQDGALVGAVTAEDAISLEPVRAECNCRYPHEGRPEGINEGCGQGGSLQPPQ